MLRFSLTRILLNSSECLNWHAPQRCPIPNSNLRLLRKGGKGREISFAVREPSETEQEKDCGGGHHCLSDLLGRAEKWPFLGLRRGGRKGKKGRGVKVCQRILGLRQRQPLRKRQSLVLPLEQNGTDNASLHAIFLAQPVNREKSPFSQVISFSSCRC